MKHLHGVVCPPGPDKMTSSQITLNRRLQNARFQTWRLGGHFAPDATLTPLPSALRTSGAAAMDLAHTQISALRNHLQYTGGRWYVVTASANDGSAIHEVCPTAAPTLSHVASIPSTEGSHTLEAVLDPSLAAVAGYSTDSSSSSSPLVFSSGQGDLALVLPAADSSSTAHVSAPVYPLAPAAPLTGVRPFCLEAAAAAADGTIACLLWGVREQQGVDPSGRRYRHVVDCHLVTLTVSHFGTSSCGLVVTSAQQLQVAPGPPSAAWLSPGDLNLWLLSEPPLECAGAAAPAAGATPPTAAAAAAGVGTLTAGNGGGPAPIDDEDEGDDIDPRTLEQAAARLAAYTSDTPVGALPDHGWADVYRETGPEELSGFSTSPGWVLTHWSISLPLPASSSSPSSSQPDPAASNGAAAAGQAGPAARVKLQGSLLGGPHELLAVQPLHPGGQCRSSAAAGGQEQEQQQQQQQQRPGWLLAVADDVDCAVLRVLLDPHSATPEAVHNSYIPALAYVVSGKQQRRHLLLGEQPCSISAALVECQQYMYCYGVVGSEDTTGMQEIVPLPLEPPETVMGAALAASAGSCHPDLVLVLTQHHLVSWQLRSS